MLGKLLKFELKHSARYVMTIYGCAAALAVLMLVGMLVRLTFISVIGSMVLYFVGIVAVIMTLVAVIKNFYDTLYGKQGYLSFTLPVKGSTLLLSKIIISFFWIIMSMVLMAGIFVLIFLNAKRQADGTFDGIFEMLKASGLLEMLPSGAMIAKLVFYLAAGVLLNILVFVGFVFFAVTLANTRALQSHPKAYGFLIFFVTYSTANSIGAKLTYSFPLSVQVTAEKVYLGLESMSSSINVLTSFGAGGTIFMAVVAVGLLAVTGWIMENKVNVK